MADALIDTDVFVDHLRGARSLSSIRRGSYSSITRAELFAGPEDQEILVEGILLSYTEIPVDRSIAQRAGRIRRVTRLPIPDAVIAATALERGLDLVTRNARDFMKVSGLTVRDPTAM
ncbi:MAG: type II toxin-antitoxin system VapC family toxin [Chloroflexota bacterium]|nr:type II toxin-antitoxin system VapC family toxin [Chloroflexota bacterium]